MSFATLQRVPAVFGLIGVTALLAGTATAEPRLFVEPKEIDLGVIQEGNSFERFLEISNAGDGVLVLEDVKTSCGCTAAAVEGVVELTAGQSQKIRVTFNSKNMDGDITKKVTISTNDPITPQVSVNLKANVHKPVRWLPKYFSLDRVGPKDTWEQTARLESDENLGLEVTEAYILGGRLRDKPSKLFDLKVQGPTEEDERRVHEFDVALVPGGKPQKLSETLVVVTNQPAPNDTLRFAIRGEITGRIRFVPNFAVLRMVPPGEETTRDITFTASEGTFRIVKAEVADSPVQVEIIPQPGDRQSQVRLTYVGEEAGVNGVRTLRVETDDPDQTVIEIPVRYQTRADTGPPATSTRAAGP
jgi:hypothetical protein